MSVKAVAYLYIAGTAALGSFLTYFLLPAFGADKPLAIGCPFTLALAGIVCLVLAVIDIVQERS